jgi:uncharacterized membrane protein YsdA (DUF1294 family)
MRPEWAHGLFALAAVLVVGGGLLWLARPNLSWVRVGIAWLAAVNLVTFLEYAYDKMRARTAGRRVPEVILHGLALAGGSPAAYVAMNMLRHKTIKGRFRLVFWLIVVLQLGLILWLAYRWWRGG